MRNWLVTLGLALAACAVSFGVFYGVNREPPTLRAAARDGDPMAWLKVEFKLTDAQFASIKELHEQYGTVCGEHCAAIMAAQKRHAPRVEITALETECVQSMTDHFRKVASLMAPAEGQRYLAMVMPRINDYEHRGAPNLQGRP